ncbi:MAG: hypothetical protein GY786_14625 [Proteobacteria bacterium]|nr:hypothetical protein [Pseudomonadota bacterium]
MSTNTNAIDEFIDLSYASHERLSKFNRLVYPVISRRSGGLSLGINLNPDKACTFDCVYCQVDRIEQASVIPLDLIQIQNELEHWIQRILDKGNNYRGYPLMDIAIAGDGEPTAVKELPALIEILIELKKKYRLDDCKLVLFTNGTNVNAKKLKSILPSFFKHQGEIWFKLDYWDQESLQRINRTRSSFNRLTNNLKTIGSSFPLVLQSCFFSWQGESLQPSHYRKYRALLKSIIDEGTQIRLIQAYTLARKPAENQANPWSNREMDEITAYLKEDLDLPIETYYEKGEQ